MDFLIKSHAENQANKSKHLSDKSLVQVTQPICDAAEVASRHRQDKQYDQHNVQRCVPFESKLVAILNQIVTIEECQDEHISIWRGEIKGAMAIAFDLGYVPERPAVFVKGVHYR